MGNDPRGADSFCCKSIKPWPLIYRRGRHWPKDRVGKESGRQHSRPLPAGLVEVWPSLQEIRFPFSRGSGSYDSRWIRASIPWTRSKTLQVICLYGFDVGAHASQKQNSALHRSVYQELHLLGRSPYLIGGDWNLSPEQLLPTWLRPGCAVAPGESTCDTGSQLDWFMVAPVMAPLATATVCHAPVAVHRPVLLHLRHHWLVDLGWRVITPLTFKEEAGGRARPPGVTLQDGLSLEEYWLQWTTGWEKFLTEWHGLRGGQYLGRGKALRWARNTVGARQHKLEGSALNAAAQKLLSVLNRVRRIRILLRVRPLGFERELGRLTIWCLRLRVTRKAYTPCLARSIIVRCSNCGKSAAPCGKHGSIRCGVQPRVESF